MVEDYIECLFVKIKGKKQSYVAGVVYRPPNSNVVEFSNTMHYILEKLGRQQCYIMGDFNLDLLKHEKHPPTEQFLDMMYSNAYIPLINRPTRITKATSTLIDNIFTNNYDVKDSLYSGILQTDISDHHIVFHLSESDIINSQKNEYNLVRIANADRIAQYVQSIQNTDCTFLDTYQHCQYYFSKFLTKFKNIYDESFPLVRVKTQYRNRLPWLSKGMKESIKLKNKLYGISLKHPTFYNINRYKTYKNKLTSILKQEEKLYYQSQILANKNDLKKVWTIIKHVINKRRNAKTSDKFIQNNKIITDPKEIANGFNDYFVNIGPGLASKINTSATSYQSYLPESFNSSFFLQPTCENEIKKLICQLKEGAAGNDGISPKYLKCVSEVIAYPLTRIANLSFEGVFPEELKCANVIPLYKAQDPMLFNNYRPISLLSVFSKIIERLMYNRLVEFLNKNNFFNKYQFGFRNNHSTVMALIVLFENLTEALDKGDCAIGIFLDFQKAFDTVNHNIVLDKLYVYGIRGIAHEWFINYLSNRTQSVNYHECVSDSKTLKCGVPQGSILGPLLFLIYINDLPSVSTLFMPILFADDTNLFCNGQNLDDLVQKINIEMEKIYFWVKANKLSLNVDKTNFMLFTPKHFSRSMGNIYINGTCIIEVTETKFLGVIIDYKLNWSSHIMNINKKIAKGIGIILKARKVFNNETLISLYYTFVYPFKLLHSCMGESIEHSSEKSISITKQSASQCDWCSTSNQCASNIHRGEHSACETSLQLQCSIVHV